MLKFLHAVGLTNLSDADVEKYYDARRASLNGSSIHIGGTTPWADRVKRLMDLSVASAMFILVLPLFVAIALLIKLTSSGPVFLAQERMGLCGRRFRLHKFRTLFAGLETKLPELAHLADADGPIFVIQNDPRVTPIGRFLRRTSLDELPQLINVLAGDMSLVGPRPLPLGLYYKNGDEDWGRRFSLRPGIVSLWAVQGKRYIGFAEWKELDEEYVDGWSLLLDIKILLKTIPTVLTGSSASLEWPKKWVRDGGEVARFKAEAVLEWR